MISASRTFTSTQARPRQPSRSAPAAWELARLQSPWRRPASLLEISSTQHTLARRYHLNDYVTWQRGRSPRAVRRGLGIQSRRERSPRTDEPATLTLFSPQRDAASQHPRCPSAFRTLDDILQLPLQSVTVGIGDPRVPQANGSLVRSWHTLRLFFQDTWRLHPRLTVNYGLGWSIDRNLNYDLTKPALLAPILGADGLGPTRKQWKNFSPVVGLAWAPGVTARL